MNYPVYLFDWIEEWDSSVEPSNLSNYDDYKTARKYSDMYMKIESLYSCKWKRDYCFDLGLCPTIEKWLNNFESRDEKRIAFELIPNIIFYSKKEMEVLCKVALKKMFGRMDIEIEKIRRSSFVNNNFIFIPLTDSGAIWCRTLRQNYLRNEIVKQSISELNESELSYRKYLVFVEDFIGSGADAVKKYQDFKLDQKREKFPETNYYLLVLIATQWAIEHIQNNTRFNVIEGEVLDTKYKAFSNDSIIYSENIRKREAKKVFLKYGRKLCINDSEIKGFPLGFNDGQLTIVLCDNTPDNTLPVIWYPDKSWFPLFERFQRYHG